MAVTGEKVLQLCASHPVGVESAIHAMRGFLDDDESDGILLIDADNAFNRVNRAVALWNIQYICPAMKHVLINFYRSPTRIFMNGEGFFELLSQEGTTQGCPLAIAMRYRLCPCSSNYSLTASKCGMQTMRLDVTSL